MSIFEPHYLAEYTQLTREKGLCTDIDLLTFPEVYAKCEAGKRPITMLTNIEIVCSGIGYIYLEKAASEINKNPDYNIIYAVRGYTLVGVLITKKGECKVFPHIHSVYLVCSKESGLGTILVGAYLYCATYIDHNVGILEIVGDYKNTKAFFSYSKMGFEPSYFLYGEGCFTNCMPMMAIIDKNTRSQIIERVKAKDYKGDIGMSNHPFFIKYYGDSKKAMRDSKEYQDDILAYTSEFTQSIKSKFSSSYLLKKKRCKRRSVMIYKKNIKTPKKSKYKKNLKSITNYVRIHKDVQNI
jgi:hypothetical protein